MERREDTSKLWEVLERATKEVERWDEWKKQYAANPNLPKNDDTQIRQERSRDELILK